MKERKLAFALFALMGLVLGTAAVDLTDLLNPDDVILKKPSTRKPAAVQQEASEVPGTVLEVVVRTNVVTQTDYVTQTNVVTDYVTKTNIVIETRFDDREKKVLEAKQAAAEQATLIERTARENAEVARGEAEKRAVAEQVARSQAEAEVAQMRERLVAAEAKLKAAETQAAVAEKKAAAAEVARAQVASQVDEVARRALAERKAREQAEMEKRLAERRAEQERLAALAVAQRLDAVTNAPPPTVETPDYAPDRSAAAAEKPVATVKRPARKAEEKTVARTGRDAVITADRLDFDRKEGVILFDRNVYVDDEEYQMHADRLFVFLETNVLTKASSEKKGKKVSEKQAKSAGGIAGLTGGGTSLKRLVAIGNVSITNGMRSAFCSRATYAKKTGKIVMYGSEGVTPWILDPQQSATPQYGEKITFWTISEQIEVEKPVLTGQALGGGKGAGGNPLDALRK